MFPIAEIIEHVKSTEEETALAKESSRQLAQLLDGREELRLEFHENGTSSQSIILPRPAARLLVQILSEMGKGNPVSLVPGNAEFTVANAADFLNVSQNFLSKLLEEGRIPSRKNGENLRVQFRDLVEYKSKTNLERQMAVEQLVSEAQEMNIGY